MILKVEGGGLPGFRVKVGKLDFDDSSGVKMDFFQFENKEGNLFGPNVQSKTLCCIRPGMINNGPRIEICV